MSVELIYTSSPRGLKPGSIGFCTVAATQGLPQPLADRLESISGYRPLFPLGHARAGQNPVNWCHYRVPAAGRTWSVLSRIAFAGSDYTGRSNKIASHLALEPSELLPAGPAAMLRVPGLLADRFDGEPRLLPPRSMPAGLAGPHGPCLTWQHLTGDAGWAGVIAEQFVLDPSRPFHLLLPQAIEPLPLVDEVLGLLSPEQRWLVTFSTYFTDPPAGLTCALRVVVDGSPLAEQLRRAGAVSLLDLTRPLGDLAEGRYVTYARTGRPEHAPAMPAGRTVQLNRAAPEPSVARAPRAAAPAAIDLAEPSPALEWVAPSPLRTNIAEPKTQRGWSLTPRWIGLAAAALLVSFAAGTWLGYSLRPGPPAATMANASQLPALELPSGGPAAATPLPTEPPAATDQPTAPAPPPDNLATTAPQASPPPTPPVEPVDAAAASTQPTTAVADASGGTTPRGGAAPTPAKPPAAAETPGPVPTTPATSSDSYGAGGAANPPSTPTDRPLPRRPTADELRQRGLMSSPPVVFDLEEKVDTLNSGRTELMPAANAAAESPTYLQKEIPGLSANAVLYWNMELHCGRVPDTDVVLLESRDGLKATQGKNSVRLAIDNGYLRITLAEGTDRESARTLLSDFSVVSSVGDGPAPIRVQFSKLRGTASRDSQAPWNYETVRSLAGKEKLRWPYPGEGGNESSAHGDKTVFSIVPVNLGITHSQPNRGEHEFAPTDGEGLDPNAGRTFKVRMVTQTDPSTGVFYSWESLFGNSLEVAAETLEEKRKAEQDAEQKKDESAKNQAASARKAWTAWLKSLNSIELIVIERQNAYGKVLFRGEFTGPAYKPTPEKKGKGS